MFSIFVMSAFHLLSFLERLRIFVSIHISNCRKRWTLTLLFGVHNVS